ncbi:30S ribosomal protein S7 [bacterium]|nr:30S ribosomal protein S7 [bacterium]
MPRRRRAQKRQLPPDHRYGSVLVTRFINSLMRRGKKTVAQRIFYDALDLIEQKTGKRGIDIFERAIQNVRPQLEVRSRRVGGATYQVPVEVRPDRQISLAIRWIIQHAKMRHEHGMTQKLAAEIIDAANNTGGAIKKKEDTLKMAEANRAFAHYRW